jgi:hypothetical protein
MATNTAGTAARQYNQQMVHYLRKGFTFSDDGLTLTVGIVPVGAIVIRAGVVVSTAFNAGTTNVLDIGTSGDTDGFATDLALGTIGVIVADEMATTNDAGPYASDTTIQAVVDLTGTAATAGAGEIWVEFIPDNDG